MCNLKTVTFYIQIKKIPANSESSELSRGMPDQVEI